MLAQSQKDPRWATRTIGNTKLSMGGYGCLITALGNYLEKRPDDVNATLTRGHCFNIQGELDLNLVAPIYGLTYKKLAETNTPPDLACIAETNNFSKEGFPKHFFIWLGKYIIDSLDGKVKLNGYHVVSWRVFTLKG